jgi:hypothetical protein
MKIFRSIFVVSLAVLVFCACAGTRAKHVYRAVLHEWTRSGEAFQSELLFISVKWHASLLSPDLLLAQANEVGNVYQAGDERDAFLASESTRYRGTISFFVSFYSFEHKYSDLSREDCSWKLSLVDHGARSTPLTIQKIHTLTPLQRYLFPYVDTWSSFYIVSFPRAASTNYHGLELSIRGPDGSSHLDWP